jgi:death-on-curing protein
VTDPDFLTTRDLLDIAAGVLPAVQVRDAGLLESAAARPRITVFGDPAYPDLFSQAGALLQSLVRNHPLVDGNKRLAWSAARVFLLMNDVDLEYDVDDAEQLVLRAARGEDDVAVIASWLSTRAELRPR